MAYETLKLIASHSIKEAKKPKVSDPLEERLHRIAKAHLRGDIGNNFYMVAGAVGDYGSIDAETLILYTPVSGKDDMAIVIAATEGETYDDIHTAVIANLDTGEIVGAQKGLTTMSSTPDLTPVKHYSITKYKKNEPVVIREEYITGSFAWQAVMVASEKADAFVITAGVLGTELPAMYLIVKQAYGFTLNVETGEGLGATEIDPDVRVPIIMARDEKLARELYSKLAKEELKL